MDEPGMKELIDRVCRGIASTQEGRKLREYIEDLQKRVSFAADALTVVERRRDELRDRLRATVAVKSRQQFMYCPATSLLRCELRDCIDKGCALVIDGSCSGRVLFADTLVKARELNAELRRAADADNTKELTT